MVIEKEKRKPKPWFISRELSLSNIIAIGGFIVGGLTFYDSVRDSLEAVKYERIRMVDVERRRDKEMEKIREDLDTLLRERRNETCTSQPVDRPAAPDSHGAKR